MRTTHIISSGRVGEVAELLESFADTQDLVNYGNLLQLTGLFVFSMVAAGAAVLTDDQLLGGICLVSFGDVVEVTAFGAFQTHVLSGTFFCHVVLIICIDCFAASLLAMTKKGR